MQPFNGIFCDEISEFESSTPAMQSVSVGYVSRDRIWGLSETEHRLSRIRSIAPTRCEHVEFSFDVAEDEIRSPRHDGEITTCKAAANSRATALQLSPRVRVPSSRVIFLHSS